jgi:trigger factor
MAVTVEDRSTVKKVLHIEVPEEEITRELDKAYEQIRKTAKIKGFRPGKAPRSVLERLFKKDVHADVSSKLIQESLLAAIQEKDLKLLGTPQIDSPELSGQGPLKYSATVEIKPEIADIEIRGLDLKKIRYSVSPEEIDAQLKQLQKSLAQLSPLKEERPARDGDFVLMDYEGFEDGKPYPETQKTEGYTQKIGDGPISKDLDEQLIGMKPGEGKDIPVHFPAEHANPKLAGRAITFRVDLKEIREEILPEIDDEFAKDLGKYETLDELKGAITKNLMEGYEKRSDQEINEQIFQKLLSQGDFEVPETLVEYELEGIIADTQKAYAYHNLSMDELGLTREKLAERYRETAEKQVRRYLILNKIIEQEKLSVSDEEISHALQEMAERMGQTLETVKGYYHQNEDRMTMLRQSLLEKKALGLIIAQGAVEEVKPEKE